ncbi:hypothetical protein [[Eubacterium] cellulosolvens]
MKITSNTRNYLSVLIVLGLIVSSLVLSVKGQPIFLDLSDHKIWTNKNVYHVGEEITVYVNITGSVPDEMISSWKLLIYRSDSNMPRSLNLPRKLDLGPLSSGIHFINFTAEPPSSEIILQLWLEPKADINLLQSGTPNHYIEIREKTSYPLLFTLIIAFCIAFLIIGFFLKNLQSKKLRKKFDQ